ncbi:cytochrome P450 89A2-like [Aristolochia californica]|uniref:cytochrome P450 89A2-like n=1 Tax=Aristolochia californica TaxID=171875 RepID=UPI0035D5CB93
MALVKNGAAFGNRIPAAPENFRLFGGDESEPFIGFTDCGPLWRAFRRNLNTELLSPAKLNSFAGAREELVQKLFEKLGNEAGAESDGGVVRPLEIFRFVLFALGLSMCFAETLDDKEILEQMQAVRASHQNLGRFFVFHVFPRFGKYLFPKMWKEMIAIRRRLVENLLPLIQSRARKLEKNLQIESYADSLIALKLPDGGKLREPEIATLCFEFLTAGVSTVVSSLQWTMANLVKYPDVQSKLYEEIVSVTGSGDGIIKEEELKKLPYVKAVVLETLRKHPPIHTLLPHRVTEEMTMEGYTIPKDTFVNFMLVSMGRDGKVWDDPMAFRPERFLGGREAVDLTGTTEIKMIPFGAGRRVCPGMGIGTLHLEFLVANMVKEFEWKVVDGGGVDMTETMHNDIDYSMKTPLRAHIVPRRGKF